MERALGNLVDNAVKWAEARVEIALAGETVPCVTTGLVKPFVSSGDELLARMTARALLRRSGLYRTGG